MDAGRGYFSSRIASFSSLSERLIGHGQACVDSRAPRKGLDTIITPGDVLVIKGSDRFSLVGAAGGYAGHVALVVATPTFIEEHSPEAEDLLLDWPECCVWPLWKVGTLECTRMATGLHQADFLLHVDEKSGQLELIGEHNSERCIEFDKEITEVWQTPAELRTDFREDWMAELVGIMKTNDASWCWATAARAFLLPATFSDSSKPSTILRDVQESWTAEPICTSVIVAFWQRYLIELAESGHAGSPSSVQSAVDLILRWMPLRADRTLPKDLLESMLKCGWVAVLKVPQKESL